MDITKDHHWSKVDKKYRVTTVFCSDDQKTDNQSKKATGRLACAGNQKPNMA